MRSVQEDAELIRNYLETQDLDLREQIILRYVPLIHFVLGRLGFSRSATADYEDAVSQGLLGLIDALEKYDPTFGTVFSTYATLRIRGQILDYLRSLDWLPRTARQRAKAVQEATAQLWNKYNRAPTDDELAGYLKIDMSQLQNALLDSSRVILSLDLITDMSGNDEESSLHEILADEQQPNPSEVFEDQDLQGQLVSALKRLSEREQLLLSLYYYEELTLKEIGAVLGVSESRVSQLHSRAIMNLRSLVNVSDVEDLFAHPSQMVDFED